MPIAVAPGKDPPVVFVSQMDTDGASWRSVIDRLASGPVTVTYDRPGIGDCPPRPAPNPALPYSAFAAELVEVLVGCGLAGPD